MKISRILSLTALSAICIGAFATSPLFAVRTAPTPVRPSTVSMALIFDSHIPATQLKTDETNENVGYVWGANAAESPGGPARHDLYVAWAQGWCPGVGIYGPCPKGGPPSFQWLRTNHPGWILWQADKKGKPTVPAHSFANPGPILDFTNRALQQYWMSHYITRGLKLGLDGVAWDGPLASNAYAAVGHYNIYHHFIRQYNGQPEDKRWARAQTRALAGFLKHVRAINPKAQFALNASPDCLTGYATRVLWRLPLRYADTIVDEEGYTNWGSQRYPWLESRKGASCGNRWLLKTSSYIQVQKKGEHVVLVDQVPLNVTPYMTHTNMRARAYLQWALANYLLIKYSHTYFWFGGVQHYGYPIALQREELANLGKATRDMRHIQGVYVRFFTKGMALVNPSPKKSFTVNLGKGTYKNLYGKNLNRVRMAPHSGLVLLVRH